MDNHKRTYRIYKEEGLNLRSKRPRRSRAAAHRLERFEPTAPHQSWSMDFVAGNLFDGRRFRALTIVDNFSRESIEIAVEQSMKGTDVVEVLESVRIFRRLVPDRIQVDSGSEFISKAMDKWAHDNNVILDFSRPGKPTDKSVYQTFNGSFRDECLNTNWFLSVEDAREKIRAWKDEYNGFRPHSSLSGLTPNQVVADYIRDSNFCTFERY